MTAFSPQRSRHSLRVGSTQSVAVAGAGHVEMQQVGRVRTRLDRENRELKRANEILRKASAQFAQAELDC